jgi:hypothetical protein
MTRTSGPLTLGSRRARRPRYHGVSVTTPAPWRRPPEHPTVSVVLLVEPAAHSVRDALARIPQDVRDTIVVDRRSDDVLDIGVAEPRADVRLMRGASATRAQARARGVDEARGDIIVVVTFGRDGSTAAPAAITALVRTLRDGADYATTAGREHGLRGLAVTAAQRITSMLRFDRIGRFRRDASSSGRAFWRECVPLLGLERTDVETDAQLDRRALDVGLRVSAIDDRQPADATLHDVRTTSRV